MAIIQTKGNTLTVHTQSGDVIYTIKRIKGLITYSVYKEDGSVLKGGFTNIQQAKEYIISWVSGWK